jgi:phosphate transport system substrate-binding protein
MNKFVVCILSAVILLGCQQRQAQSPTRGSITILSTESLAPLIQQEANEFQRLYPEASVSVHPTSTRDAIVQMINDSVRLVFTDRPLNGEELHTTKQFNIDYVEKKIAQSALAVVVNGANPLEKIAFSDLRDVLNGTIVQWRSIPASYRQGRVELILTSRNSGVYELLISHFFNLAEPIVPNIIADSEKHVVELVASNKHGIGVVSVSAVHDTVGTPELRTLRQQIRIIAVGGRDSSNATTFTKLHQANVYRELYPLHYPVYLYTTASATSVAAGFSAFVTSTIGQKIILNAGLVPAAMPVRLVQLTQEQPSQ